MNALRRLLPWNPKRVPGPPRRDCGGKATSVRTRFLKFATLLGAVAVLWACNAPFIPVPPPGASFTSQLVDDGMGGQKTVWITHGLPSSNAAFASYFIINTSLVPQAGIIATAGADGTFTDMPLENTMSDRIRVGYETPEGNQSESICLLLTEEVSATTGSAPPCLPSP